MTLVKDAWHNMLQCGASLWALSTSVNPFRMEADRKSLRNGLCNGFFWGCRVRHNPELLLRYGDGHEDIERTVRYFNLDGVVLRYRGICAKTRCKRNRGGLQASMTSSERLSQETQGVEDLLK